MTQTSHTCEWHGCERRATSVTEFGDVLLCNGHRMWADANYETHGDHGISAEEYIKRVKVARVVLAEDEENA